MVKAISSKGNIMSVFKNIGARIGIAALLSLFAISTVTAADKTIRIGFQKYGTLVLLKAKGTLEKKLEPLGVKVVWTEFPSGPPLLEAINVGAIDFGTAGETPPIFAQAAGAPILYVAHEPPAPKGEAILVPKDSPIKSVADLKGKKVALNKGSNVHYLLVKALEKAGLQYSDIEPVFLAPADARAAFERGAVQAWVIWDPFQAAAEAATAARVLADGTGIVANHQFYLAEQKFAEANPRIIDAVIASVAEIDNWAKDDAKAVAEQLSAAIGIPAAVLEVALKRQAYGIKPLDEGVVAEQQRIADTFHALGLLPKPINVSSAIRRAGS
jgi:sulfonate transport system substrate-binding protein